MADKRITDVDFLDSLNSDESFFVNQNNSVKQINKGNIIFDVVNGGTGANNIEDARTNLGLGSVAIEDITPISKGGTGATDATVALSNLGAATVDHTHSASELGVATENHTHNITELDDFSAHVYDATIPRNANTFLASPNGSSGTASFRKIADADLPTIQITKGGTGSSNGATGLKNLLAAGETILSSYQYGDSLPSSGTAGRIFFKKVSG